MAMTSTVRSPKQNIISLITEPAKRNEDNRNKPIDFAVCKSARDMKKAIIPGQLNLFELVICNAAPPKKPSDKRLSPEELFEKNQGLVKSIMSLTGGCNPGNWDDVAQQGYMALWNASTRFDYSLGYQFSSYAVPAIRRAVYRELKHLNHKNTVSLEAMQEGRDDNGDLRYERFTATDKGSPVELSEDKEIVQLLFDLAEKSTTRIKEKKGIKALAMQVQGYDSKAIAQEIGVAPKSYTALISAGRRALKSNPQLLSYISAIKNKDAESVQTSILGDDYTVAYTDTAYYDCVDRASAEHLSLLAKLLGDETVADSLLDEVRIGEDVVIIDEDYRVSTLLNFGMDKIEVSSVRRIKGRVPERKSA